MQAKMIFVRPFVLRFFNALPSGEDSTGLWRPHLAIIPFSQSLCLALGWREVDMGFLDAARDKKWLQAFVDEIDESILAARDQYHAISGEFGLLRAIDAFCSTVYVCGDSSDISPLSTVDRIELAANTPDQPAIQIVHHLEKIGYSRPSPVSPEAAFLLAQAEGERERFPSIVAYIKIFERAFGLSEDKLIVALEKYFKHAQVSYAKSEIRKWFNMRGEDAHATKRIARFDHVKYDITMYRLRQAAIDVAHNKRDWGDKRSLRDKRVQLVAWYDENGKGKVTPGKKVEFVMRRELLGKRLIDPRLSAADEAALKGRQRDFVRDELLRDCASIHTLAIFGEGEKIKISRLGDSEQSPTEYLWIIEN